MSPSTTTKYWPPLSWRLFQRFKTVDKLKIISEVAQDKRVNTIYRFHRLVIDREDIMISLECLIHSKLWAMAAGYSLECLIYSKLWAMAAGYSLECLIHSKLWAIAAGYSQKSMREKTNLVFAESYLRDRPFKLKGGLWFFVSFRTFLSDNTRVRIFIFFVAQSAKFFAVFNIRLYDKNSESD
jgi:hypothetical protein